jgi:hypothetical protein
MVSSQEARSRNFRNAALAAIVPLPAILFYLSFLHLCPNGSNEEENQVLDQWGLRVCKLGENHPIAFLNIIVFFCFSVLFWIISLFQQSTWLVDPYWTIVPVMIGYYYSTHPHAKSDPWRSTTVMILLWVWNIRLEHSYFRREKWQWGATEDWRFADMRKQYQGHWWWASFFLCYISQQVQTLSSHHCCLQDFFTLHVLIFHSDHLLPIYHPSKTIYNPSTTSGGDIYLFICRMHMRCQQQGTNCKSNMEFFFWP